MSFGTTYRDQLNTIMRAVRYNLARITVANGFRTTVVLVHDRDAPIRPGSYTGPIIKVTDLEDVESYRPGQEAWSDLRYDVEGFLPNKADGTLRTALRAFAEDFVAAHYGDVYLAAADLANGGSGSRLVGRHRINKIVRQYVFPNGYFRAEVACQFLWNTGATT